MTAALIWVASAGYVGGVFGVACWLGARRRRGDA